MQCISRAAVWAAVAVVAFLLFLSNPLATLATQYNREVAVAGTGFYATLRSANAVMSVLKDADVQGSVGVVSISGSPGQVLQPVTETIGRMADLLFALTIASGVLSFVLVPASKVSALVLGVAAAARAGGMVIGRPFPLAVHSLLRTILFTGLLGALVVPASYAIAFVAGNHITAEAWRNATATFDQVGAKFSTEAVAEQISSADETATEQIASVDDAAVVQEPEAPADQAAPTQDAEEEDGGLFRSGIRVFGSAVDASKTAIGNTVEAAVNLPASLTSSVTSRISSTTQSIQEALELSSALFSASVEIAVSYIVKLIVLPILIVVVGFFLLRAVFRPV